jgi:CheY-like chemotaxis protein
MPTTLKGKKPKGANSTVPWGQMPPALHVLYITTRARTGAWLAEAFAADSAAEILLDQVLGSAAGLARLRDEPFDAVLVSHEPGELDALALIEAYRAGGADEPIVVLGTQSEQEMAVLCYEVGADSYVCVNTATTRNLIWMVVRAVQRHQLSRENRRLNQAERTRLQREHEESQRLLEQQRSLLGHAPHSPPFSLPAELVAHYRELLRTYVIMGSGNLACELSRLAELLVSAGLTARQAIELHLTVLEELLHGLGTRSTRHVMTRADLLALELLLCLADGYRQRWRDYVNPPVQRMLPGFGRGVCEPLPAD